MYNNLSETDILVVVYPNKSSPKLLLILDPFDKKILYFKIDSLDEAKEILMKNLPFCYQDHEPEIHLGSAHLVEWESLPSSETRIYKPQDVDKLLS